MSGLAKLLTACVGAVLVREAWQRFRPVGFYQAGILDPAELPTGRKWIQVFGNPKDAVLIPSRQVRPQRDKAVVK